MSKFELNYKEEVDYEEKIDLEIRLKIKPDTEDYQTILDAVDALDKVAQKYLSRSMPSIVVKGKS